MRSQMLLPALAASGPSGAAAGPGGPPQPARGILGPTANPGPAPGPARLTPALTWPRRHCQTCGQKDKVSSDHDVSPSEHTVRSESSSGEVEQERQEGVVFALARALTSANEFMALLGPLGLGGGLRCARHLSHENTMTMDMHLQQRGGLRVEAASLSNKGSTASPASSEASPLSERTGSPAGSPAASPSLPMPVIHHHNNNNNNNNNKSPPPHQTNKISIKRSFDVAFLMAPDDLSTIKKRHQEQEQQLRLVTTASLMMRSAMTPLNVAITPPQPPEQQQQRILQQHPPSLMVMGHGLHDDQARSAFTKVSSSASSLSGSLTGSVGGVGAGAAGLLLMQNPPLPTSPSSVSSVSGGGLSPAYQNSLSPSPGPGPASSASAASTPTSTPLGAAPGAHGAAVPGAGSPQYVYHSAPGGVGPTGPTPYGAPPFYVPQAHPPPPPAAPAVGAPPPASSPSPSPQDKQAPKGRRYSPPTANGAASFPFSSYGKPQELMAGFHKLSRPSQSGPGPGLGPVGPGPMLYPDSLAAYTNLAAAAAAAYPFGAAPAPAAPSAGSALAAAVSASLMPPTLAALSLPAQNVCAKCNVSFRMTSDLVYHMRAHHKSDHAVNDPGRRRREQDKLKCPVCAESFRERHHLT
ncbi:PR domain zinc finger protein 8, partial [Frankliniella fusca]